MADSDSIELDVGPSIIPQAREDTLFAPYKYPRKPRKAKPTPIISVPRQVTICFSLAAVLGIILAVVWLIEVGDDAVTPVSLTPAAGSARSSMWSG